MSVPPKPAPAAVGQLSMVDDGAGGLGGTPGPRARRPDERLRATGGSSRGGSAASRLTPTDRVEAFSDGVFAIAITLLVLEVHVPATAEVDARGGLLPALTHAWPSYLSYLATFLTIGVIWLNHHGVFAKIRRVDRTLQWWNLVLLLTVSFTPFPNALVAAFLREGLTSEPARTATAVYALVFTASTVPWVFIWSHQSRRPELMGPGYDRRHALTERRRSVVGVVVYAVAIPVAVAAPLLAVLLFLASAVFYALTAEGSSAPRPDGSDPTGFS